jgi:hypothetical protein
MSDGTIPVLDPEVVTTELVKVEQQAGIDADSALALRGKFGDYYNEIVALREKVAMVTDRADPIHQKLAREIRLGLKNVRCEVERTRKALKKNSLARSKFIDGVAGYIMNILCEPVEEQLAAVERYAERQEAERIAALVAERTAALVAVECDPTAYNVGVMDEPTFALVLAGAKKQREDRIEAARKAEADRIAAERAAALERERIIAENKRLNDERAAVEAKAKREREIAAARQREVEAKAKAERDAAEAKARVEKAKADAKLAAEREARESLERQVAEAKAKEEARLDYERLQEKARVRAEKEAVEKAARAPDKEKLRVFAETLAALPLPKMTTAAGSIALKQVETTLKLAISAAMNESARL